MQCATISKKSSWNRIVIKCIKIKKCGRTNKFRVWDPGANQNKNEYVPNNYFCDI